MELQTERPCKICFARWDGQESDDLEWWAESSHNECMPSAGTAS